MATWAEHIADKLPIDGAGRFAQLLAEHDEALVSATFEGIRDYLQLNVEDTSGAMRVVCKQLDLLKAAVLAAYKRRCDAAMER